MKNDDFRVELRLSPSWNRETKRRDLAIADESTLRHDVLLGDLILEVGSIDFSARWEWIPLLDMAWCLNEISSEILAAQPESCFEFTESDAWIKLSKRGSEVEVSTSYVANRARVPLQRFCAALNVCAREFFVQVASQQPELNANLEFQRMREEVFRKPALEYSDHRIPR